MNRLHTYKTDVVHIRILSNLRLLTADEGRKKVNVSKFLNKRALKKKIHLRTQSLN